MSSKDFMFFKTGNGLRVAVCAKRLDSVVEFPEHTEIAFKSGRVMKFDSRLFDMLTGSAPRARAKPATAPAESAPAASADKPAEAQKPARRQRAPKAAPADGDKPAAPAAEGVEKKKRAPRKKAAPADAAAAPANAAE